MNQEDLPTLEDDELSLEELSAAYAKLLVEQASPSHTSLDQTREDDTAGALLNRITTERGTTESSKDHTASNDSSTLDYPITSEGIIEALLFVGRPDNNPIKVEEITSQLRGIDAIEMQKVVDRLNERYQREGQAIQIVASEEGYQMKLSVNISNYLSTLNQKVREIQLNQSAIDCLSLVCYNPGITLRQLENLWNKPASSILGMLVRRDLLSAVRQGTGKAAVTQYWPNERLLNLLGLGSLEDLPRVDSEF